MEVNFFGSINITRTARDEPRESGGIPTLLVPESERKERGQNGNFVFGGRVPKKELEGRSKNGVQKCEEDEIKGSKSGAGSSEICRKKHARSTFHIYEKEANGVLFEVMPNRN